MVGDEQVRVLRLITRLNIGGPARQALLLNKELPARFRSTLLAGSTTSSEGELTDPHVPVTKIRLARRIDPIEDLMALRQVRDVGRSFEPHIVHTHMAKAGTIGRLAGLSMRPRPRLVHTFHGHVLEGYFSRPVEQSFLRIERWLARRTDVLIAVSPQIRDDLLGLGIGREDQWVVVPLGFDLDAFLAVEGPTGSFRERIGLDMATPLVAVAARLVPIKDHRTLFASIALLEGVHLVVLGDGELRADLESEAQRLGVADRVHFLGWCLEMDEAMADIDVAVLASLNEGTPVSLIEALAAGRPVVATDVGGVRWVVEDGVTGRLVKQRDARALADALHHLLTDAELRRKMGQAGRVAVATRFAKDRLVSDIADVYDRLVS